MIIKKTFKNKKDLIKYLRSTGDNEYNKASDEYLFNEVWHHDILHINKKGKYKLILWGLK